MNGLDEFRDSFPQAWDNFQKDSNLSNKAKAAFISHLDKFNDVDIESHAKDFFFVSAHQLIGPKATLHKKEVLGRVVPKLVFDSYIKYIFRASSRRSMPSFKSTSAQSSHLLPSSGVKLKLLVNYLGTENLSNNNMWSFRNDHKLKEPFNNRINLSDMPCVLGLKSVVPPFYRMEYKLPHDAYTPTAFDAAFFEEWRPGGRSYPLPKCRRKYSRGLIEIIHKPNRFLDLVKPLEEFK